MHIAFDSLVKYVLWFAFCVVSGSFLFGLVRFGFNFPVYIEYLNNIEFTQLFSGNTKNSESLPISGDVVDLSGNDLSGVDIYDPDIHADIFDLSGSDLSGATDNESFGFVKNLEITGKNETPVVQAQIVSSGSAGMLTGDTKEQLKNLILDEQ